MAYNTAITAGIPGTGVVASTPPNFLYGTVPASQLNVTQANIGDEYTNIKTGIWYKLILTNTVRTWVSQGSSVGQLDSLTTSDSTVVLPSSGNINLTQGNGVLTTGSGATATIALSGSYSGAYTITGTGLTPLTLVSTDAGAGAGPIVNIYRNSASPAASDVIGEVTYSGNNSTPAQKVYSQSFTTIDTVTASSEDASWRLQTMQAGTLTSQIVALSTGCQIRGNNANTAPPAGYIGELLQSQVLIGSPTTLVNATAKTIQTVALTAGTWDLFLSMQVFGATTRTKYINGISANTNSFTGCIPGYSSIENLTWTGQEADNMSCTPVIAVRVTVASTTNYYGVISSTFSVGTDTAWGTLSAVRVG